MKKPPTRAWVLGLFGALVVAFVIAEPLIRTIEHQFTTNTVEHHNKTVVVAVPCINGNDIACRLFLALLLSDATRQQLEQLLHVRSIRIPAHGLPGLVRQIGALTRPHRRHHRNRPGFPRPHRVRLLPPAPIFTPAPQPRGGAPGHGQGLPGRPRPARGRP